MTGKLYDMAPPSYIHQKMILKLSRTIDQYMRLPMGHCEVLPAPFAVNLTGNDKNWVEPDISVICDKSKLSDRGCEGGSGLDYRNRIAQYAEKTIMG